MAAFPTNLKVGLVFCCASFALAVLSNPSKRSFDSFLEGWVRSRASALPLENRSEDGDVENQHFAQQWFTTPLLINLVVMTVARTSVRGVEFSFIGAVGRWFPLRSPTKGNLSLSFIQPLSEHNS
jgi:hypothetical protein